MFALGLGLLLLSSGSVLAQPVATAPAWQSLRIEQTETPVFPAALVLRGITEGQADIAIASDADGRLEDVLPVAYTHEAFAHAAVVAVRHWTFVPARLRGEPVGTMVELRFHFTAEGAVVSCVTASDTIDLQLARMLGPRFAYRPCPLNELDQTPVPVAVVAPAYSRQLEENGVKGHVTVEFFIDETGAVRLPAVVSPGNHPLLCNLAVAALSHWKFAPPTSHGRAVLVKASQEFVFGNGS